MSENIISGLISGLLATTLVFIFRSIWLALIVPWFEERVYKDIKIEGTWYSLYTSTEDQRQEIISIDRHGHTVKGTIVCVVGNDSGEKYNIMGSFRNMLLPLTYESSDTKKSDRGTITMQSIHNGERMRGKIAYYTTRENVINTTNVIWFRSKSELEGFIIDLDKKHTIIKGLQDQVQQIEKELKVVEGSVEKEESNSKNEKLSPQQEESKPPTD